MRGVAQPAEPRIPVLHPACLVERATEELCELPIVCALGGTDVTLERHAVVQALLSEPDDAGVSAIESASWLPGRRIHRPVGYPGGPDSTPQCAGFCSVPGWRSSGVARCGCA